MDRPPFRILIVDDNPDIHEDFWKILSPGPRNEKLAVMEATLFDRPLPSDLASRFELESAYQGQEALEKVKHSLADQRPYALAFMDVRMPPGWDGVETAGRLWEVDPRLQIVICTAYSDYSWEKMTDHFGVNDNLVILKKPFDNVEVVQLAHALTKKWALARRVESRVNELDRAVFDRTEELQRSEERFEIAFQASPVPMAIQRVDDHSFIDANPAFAALIGTEREAIVGRDPLSLCLAIHYGDVVPADPKDHPAQITTRSGELRDVLVSSARIDLEGEPHILLILQDLSERNRLESQLRQSQKMEAVGQLAAGVAHDFNNLLTIIEGHASLQLVIDKLTPEAQASLKEIEEAAERAADLTKKLLTFSRRTVLTPRVLDLNVLVREMSAMLRRVLGERVTLETDLEEDLPLIFADRTSIEQVIMNLTVNARDAMPNGGAIGCKTHSFEVPTVDGPPVPQGTKPGRYVALSVSDTGIGMDESIRSRIFEPFFTTKEADKGTGMGLSTVYGIIHQHEGWIDVASTPGRGTTFLVHLPVTNKPPETIRDPVPLAPPGDATFSVFAVEDDAAVRGLVVEILAHHGYRVIEAPSGDAALGMWSGIRDEVDLLLTDMVMPGEHNGLDLARKLVVDRPDLPIIYTSGYSRELFSGDIALQEGRNYLPKPYLTAKLLAIIRNALDGKTPRKK